MKPNKLRSFPPYAWAILGLVGGLLLAWLFFSDGPEAQETNVEEAHEHEAEAEAGTVWTCSMHPQIRQNEPGLCPICGMELIPLTQEQGDNELQVTLSSTAAALANVETIRLGATSASAESRDGGLQLSGQLQIAEDNIFSQVSHIPGRIEQLFVNTTGERVKAGQALASVYSPELLAAQQELLQARKLSGNYEGLLQAAREKLRQYRISESQIRRIEEEGRTFDRLTITADVSGVVTERMVAQGNYVQAGSVLFQIARLDQLWVALEAYENQLPLLQEGDSLQISVNATGETYPAVITFIDPVLDASRRTVRVRAEISNAKGRLRPQMLVQAELKQTAPQQAQSSNQPLTLPRSAVLWTGERSVVYVKPPDSEFGYEMREVKVQSAGDRYQVMSGLQMGEEVVVNGAFVIDAAAQLRNKPSMMNRALQLSQGKTEEAAAEEALPSYEAPAALKENLKPLIEDYLHLKNALIEADAGEAKAAVRDLNGQLKKLNADGLEGEALNFFNQHTKHLAHTSKQLLGETSIDGQRRYFIGLSQAMLALIEAFDPYDRPLYRQYCPMADNDQGAYWLSEEEAVRNPYYGDLMLSCGETQKEF
jgi:Cu(I)/Ag(I) efflux system membrane fusion protein